MAYAHLTGRHLVAWLAVVRPAAEHLAELPDVMQLHDLLQRRAIESIGQPHKGKPARKNAVITWPGSIPRRGPAQSLRIPGEHRQTVRRHMGPLVWLGIVAARSRRVEPAELANYIACLASLAGTSEEDALPWRRDPERALHLIKRERQAHRRLLAAERRVLRRPSTLLAGQELAALPEALDLQRAQEESAAFGLPAFDRERREDVDATAVDGWIRTHLGGRPRAQEHAERNRDAAARLHARAALAATKLIPLASEAQHWHDDPDELSLRRDELAQRLGVTMRTLQRWKHSGSQPAPTLTRRVLFTAALRWLVDVGLPIYALEIAKQIPPLVTVRGCSRPIPCARDVLLGEPA